MKNKKGFTLYEFLLTLIIILVIIIVVLPLILYAIKTARLNAFKSSTYNVLDSVEYYLTRMNYINIPVEGINIEELELDIKNNNFDDGLIKEEEKNHLQLVYLIKNNYCAIGTKENLRVSDSGCGTLDSTPPNQVFIYLINSSNDTITIAVSTDEQDSEIISYEYSIDDNDYTEKIIQNEYTFSPIKEGKHKIKVRVTNEAGLTKESDVYIFETSKVGSINCQKQEETGIFNTEMNLICTYPKGDNYIYEYSIDHINWQSINLNDDNYTFHFDDNMVFYTRILKDKKVITTTSLNINNIDTTLNGAYPELLENMIPIIYDEKRKVWVKADSRKKYFDYENKMWANAVLVRKNAITDDPKSKSREYYLSNNAIGEEIYEGDIIGYYVWIPRYKYKLFNVSNKDNGVQTISIEFENKNTKKSLGENDKNYTNGEWYTHPAFSYNNVEKNGFWVSKFQNSAGKNSSCYLAKEASSCNISSINLHSLPDLDSITSVSISTAYLMSNNMIAKNNIYGLKSDSSSHVLTNLEWGAIAYLTNSNYGINDNLKYKNVNYKDNLTSSTTGNITGVFDMAGPFSEMVMANYNHDSGKDEKDNSGFKGYGNVEWPTNIDYYDGITSKNRILGDATGETEGWYESYHEFVNGEYPFMIRGGKMNNTFSIYNFSKSTGNYNNDLTFRTVLSKN